MKDISRAEYLLREVKRCQDWADDPDAVQLGIPQRGYWRFIELAKVVVESHRELINREPPSEGNYPPELIMALYILGTDVKEDLRQLLKEHGGVEVDMDGLGD